MAEQPRTLLVGSCHPAIVVGLLRLSLYPVPDANPHACTLGPSSVEPGLRLLCHCGRPGGPGATPYGRLDHRPAVTDQHPGSAGIGPDPLAPGLLPGLALSLQIGRA